MLLLHSCCDQQCVLSCVTYSPRSDLGAHIDGFIATGATTVLVSPDGTAAVVSGKEADLIEAARTAFNAALRLIKPGGCVFVCEGGEAEAGRGGEGACATRDVVIGQVGSLQRSTVPHQARCVCVFVGRGGGVEGGLGVRGGGREGAMLFRVCPGELGGWTACNAALRLMKQGARACAVCLRSGLRGGCGVWGSGGMRCHRGHLVSGVGLWWVGKWDSICSSAAVKQARSKAQEGG
jgi:hypothetical protein